MNRKILLVSTASRWLGTARMPRSLARAGFEVSLLAPRGSLALHSRFVTRSSVLRDESTPMQWLLSLVAMITEIEPRLVVPCDEVAIRLLFELVRHPPRHLDGNSGAPIVQLVRQSLGDPAHYETSIDKTVLPTAARALGVPVPPYAVTENVDEAVAHADALGYPVVLKRRYGFASQGVRIVQRRDDLRAAADVLLHPVQLDLGVRRAPALLVQGFLEGPMVSQTMVAWEGVPLAGFTRQREIPFMPGLGASAVVRVRKVPAIRDYTERLCRAFGMSGFFSVQFIEPANGEAPVLLEINRRIVTFMHTDEYGGVDLCGALFRRLAGLPQTLPIDMPDDADQVIVSFPREWLRDPESAWLRSHPSDIPWDDPGVFEAMVALRNE
ncbi:MAG TPA: ATP-grasp domain-containing protein [Casimicrobiaceae bacterium]|nr:ATP-grasp domain-containing protein [Casimicrobiaceae bacterium]